MAQLLSVLILVVMDDALALDKCLTSQVWKSLSLNPCCNG